MFRDSMAATAGKSSSAARRMRSSASSQSAVGLPRDDRERPPGASERLGQTGRRIDLQRGADAEAAPGALTRAEARLQADPGSSSPKSTTCGRSVPPHTTHSGARLLSA